MYKLCLVLFFFFSFSMVWAQSPNSHLESEMLIRIQENAENRKALLEIKEEAIAKGYIHAASKVSERLSIYFLVAEKYDKALENLEDAITYTDTIKNLQRYVVLLNQKGHILQVQKRYPEALKLYEKALEVSKRSGNQADLANSYYNLGNTYFKAGNTEKSQEYLREANDVYQHMKPPKGLSKGLKREPAFSNAEDYKRIIADLENLLPSLDSSGNQEEYASTLVSLGHLYFDVKNTTKAREAYETALSIAAENDYFNTEYECYRGFSQLAVHEQNFKEAIEYYDLYLAMKDSMFAREKQEEVAILRNEFALRSEEMNNAMLNTEKAALEMQQEKNQYLLVMALVLVLVLGILAILFIREANRKQKHAKDLEGINKDLSIRNRSLAMSEQEWKTRNESKDTMFSIIAHDLKSPLNSITGFVEVLTTHPEAFSGKELADYGKKMQETITNLNALLTNLLQWAMMQNGKIEFSPGPLMLKDFLSSALSLYYPLAESKMVTLELKECPDVSIQADYNMLHFVVRNLIHNAIKFSKPNGEVAMHVRASTSHCIIEVSDKGVGISSDRLKTIFDSGSRNKTPGTMQEQGTGLGLILCKEFVSRHGGNIEVESKEGNGSLFRVTLPIKGY